MARPLTLTLTRLLRRRRRGVEVRRLSARHGLHRLWLPPPAAFTARAAHAAHAAPSAVTHHAAARAAAGTPLADRTTARAATAVARAATRALNLLRPYHVHRGAPN